MKSYMLDLNSIEKVKGFVSAIEKFDGYFDMATGRYVVQKGNGCQCIYTLTAALL